MSSEQTATNKKQEKNGSISDPKELFNLARIIVIGTFIIMVFIISLYFYAGTANPTSQTILTAVLPLLGAWVGAVIAFYFSSKNLESATQSVQNLVSGLSGQEKLKTVPTKDKMIPREKMFVPTAADDTFPVMKMLSESDKANKGNRIPVLDDKDHPRYVIHRSIIDKFLAKWAVDNASKAADGKALSDQLGKLTLQQLVEDQPDLKKSFGIVRENSTLADVKALMDELGNQCQDVFVTKTGSSTDPVIGWITNIIIEDNSKVQ